VSDLVDAREEVGDWGEADVTFAEFSAVKDFGLKFVILSKEEVLSDGDFAAWSDEALPIVGLRLQLAREQNFDASAEEVTRGRILRTQGLGLETCASAIKPGGKDARVVEDDQIVGAKQIGEFAKIAVLQGSRVGRNV
jgi:hypothetical protein